MQKRCLPSVSTFLTYKTTSSLMMMETFNEYLKNKEILALLYYRTNFFDVVHVMQVNF